MYVFHTFFTKVKKSFVMFFFICKLMFLTSTTWIYKLYTVQCT